MLFSNATYLTPSIYSQDSTFQNHGGILGGRASGTVIQQNGFNDIEIANAAQAQVTVDSTIGELDWPHLKVSNLTVISGISFSSFSYRLAENAIKITNISYSATGGTCILQGTIQVHCSGKITKFTVSYDYIYDVSKIGAMSWNGLLLFNDYFYSEGFTFNGNFKITYPAGIMTFKNAEATTQVSFPNLLNWSASATNNAQNAILFELTCVLTDYTAPNFAGSLVVAHVDYVASLNRINQYASNAGVKLFITSSFRTSTLVPGSIVTPANLSNHLAGHAIDMNVMYGDNFSQLCNSVCLRKATLPPSVARFISSIKADSSLRWGGDFAETDPVHIDDGLNQTRAAWKDAYNKAQANSTCRVGKTKPKISSSSSHGKPSSYFTIMGNDFPIDTSVDILLNGLKINSLNTDSNGQFRFVLGTTLTTPIGRYEVRTVSTSSEQLNILLMSTQNITTTEDSLQIILSQDSTVRVATPSITSKIMLVPTNVQPLSLVFLPIVEYADNRETGP